MNTAAPRTPSDDHYKPAAPPAQSAASLHLPTYTNHPVANLFPDMSGKEFDELKASISHNGQLQPIVALGAEILDGRHRLKACAELGIEPKIIQFAELGLQTPPGVWIFVTNARRRNLTPDQKLAVFSAYKSWKKTDPEKSKSSTQTQSGSDQTGDSHADDSRPQPAKSDADEFPGRNRPDNSKPKRSRGRPAGTGDGRQREQLAQAVDQSQYRARQMLKLRKHLPDLATAVEQGSVTLKDATGQLNALLKTRHPDAKLPQTKSQRRGDGFGKLEKRIRSALDARAKPEQEAVAEKLLLVIFEYLKKPKRSLLLACLNADSTSGNGLAINPKSQTRPVAVDERDS